MKYSPNGGLMVMNLKVESVNNHQLNKTQAIKNGEAVLDVCKQKRNKKYTPKI